MFGKVHALIPGLSKQLLEKGKPERTATMPDANSKRVRQGTFSDLEWALQNPWAQLLFACKYQEIA